MDHPIQTDFIRWIVFLPLLGAIVNGVLGAKIQKRLGKEAIAIIACAPVVVAFGLSLYALFVLKALDPEQRFLIDNLYRWVDLGSLQVDMAFLIDPLSAVMILIVTGIGGLIHIYATGYMHDDNGFWRFCSSSVGKAWACVPMRSSVFGTPITTTRAPATRLLSSTASVISVLSSACFCFSGPSMRRGTAL